MAITNYDQARIGTSTTVIVTSDLAAEDVTVYYHWYIDGAYIETTIVPARVFYVAVDDQVRIEVVDTLDPDYDYIANAPAGWPARRSLFWVRSLADDVAYYRVEQSVSGGDWTAIGTVHHDDARWTYAFLTGRLTDLTDYAWRIVPVDTAENDGTPLSVASETVVRTPDAPNFGISFDSGTSRVTFSEAA